ncbi:F-box protein [Ceratobasidium sp. AG-Ba]|nr:F-box protein [Ceratobasidium sp. AG-Ba]
MVSPSVELVQLPNPVTKVHLKRFEVYAPFVTKIAIHHEGRRSPYPRHSNEYPIRVDNILNWESLAGCVTGNPLLPNLSGIELWYPDYLACMNWLQILLHPSTRSITIGPEWPVGEFCGLVQLVAHRSPALEYFYARPEGFGVNGPGHSELSPDLRRQYRLAFTHLASFRHMRALDASIATVCPDGLLDIVTLPRLQELRVCVRNPPQVSNDVLLDLGVFPALHRLILERVERPSWLTDFWVPSPSFSDLGSVSISMSPGWMDSPEIDGQWSAMWLLQLCINSPRLTRLSMSFADRISDKRAIIFPRGVEDSLRSLRLESFVADSATMESGCEFLSSAWPDILELRCNRQYASLSDLAGFARNLPRLEKLSLDLDWKCSTLPEYSSQSVLSPRYTAFESLCMDPLRHIERSQATSQKLAKYLYLLWPNVHCSRPWEDLFHSNPQAYHWSLDKKDKEAHNLLLALDYLIDKLRE